MRRPFHRLLAAGHEPVPNGVEGLNIPIVDGPVTPTPNDSTPVTSLVSAADPLHVWAGGEDRLTESTAIYTTEDAGTTWQALNLSSAR